MNKVTIFNVMQMDDPLRMVSELTQTDYGSTGPKFNFLISYKLYGTMVESST